MSDEEKTALETEEETAEESAEETTEEETEEPSEEEAEETTAEESAETEEKAEEETEVWDSEEDYLKEHKLPGDPKSLDEVIKSYKSLLRESKRQQTERPKADEEPVREPAPETEDRKQTFDETPVRKYVDQLIQEERISQENAASYRSLANIVDAGLAPMRTGVEKQMKMFLAGMGSIVNHVRDQSWRSFRFKHLASRDELESYMNRYGMIDFEQALRRMAVDDKPDLLPQIFRDERGRDKGGKQRKLKRFSSGRRGKPTETGTRPYAAYLTPDKALDEAKLDRLKIEQKEKIVNAYLEDFEKGRVI